MLQLGFKRVRVPHLVTWYSYGIGIKPRPTFAGKWYCISSVKLFYHQLVML